MKKLKEISKTLNHRLICNISEDNMDYLYLLARANKISISLIIDCMFEILDKEKFADLIGFLGMCNYIQKRKDNEV